MTTFDPASLRQLLAEPRPLPTDPVHQQIVMWKSFRNLDQAANYANFVMLGPGQQLVGGKTRDSLGDLYWIGVHVDDLAKWGNTRAIQLTDGFDGENPDVGGRPFER